MKLVFYDRQTAPASPSTSPTLTIERKGTFGLSVSVVQALGLQPLDKLVLAQDAATNIWYLLPKPQVLGLKPFELRARDSKTQRSLIFCSQPQARAYYAAHGLSEEKSVRASIGLVPVVHEGLKLYPLQPQHASTPSAAPVQPVTISAKPVHETPESVQVAEPAPDPAPAEQTASTRQVASKYTPEMDARLLDMANSPSDLAREWNLSAANVHARRSYLKKKAGEVPAAPAPAPVVDSSPKLVYTPAPGVAPVQKTLGLQARAEELANYWFEREISNASPNELAEMLNLMRHVPASKRGIEMSLVLDRAEAEQEHRITAAGKGGRRG